MSCCESIVNVSCGEETTSVGFGSAETCCTKGVEGVEIVDGCDTFEGVDGDCVSVVTASVFGVKVFVWGAVFVTEVVDDFKVGDGVCKFVGEPCWYVVEGDDSVGSFFGVSSGSVAADGVHGYTEHDLLAGMEFPCLG